MFLGDFVEELDQVEFDMNIDENWTKYEQLLQVSAIQRTLSKWMEIQEDI